MKIVVGDIETPRIKPDGTVDKIWIFGGKDIDTGEIKRFEPWRGQHEIDKAIEWAETVDHWVGHRFISFDLVHISKFIKRNLIKPEDVTDTLIESRTVWYGRPTPKGGDTPHSLWSWGLRLGEHKKLFNDYDNYSEEMVEYWEQDLHTNHALYDHFKRFRDNPEWQRAFRCEHDTQIDLVRQHFYGFHFNKPEAETILAEVQEQQDQLTREIQEDYPPKLVPVKTLSYRVKADGEEVESVKKAKEEYPLTQVIVGVDDDGEEEDTGELVCYDYQEFNPGSPIMRIDVLWDAGWKPFEKTKTHQKFDRMRVGSPYGKARTKMTQEFYDNKADHFKKYGWVCNEDNLATLPQNAPEGARKLAQWLTLEGRRSSLTEWIGRVSEGGRIHGYTEHIGAWTGRGAHNSPNTANISSVWSSDREPKNAVEEIKAQYDTRMRACWDVPDGSYLVGVDADGIQLRILGDWLWRYFNTREYADTIVSGRKEDGTDIHNVNRKALRLNHVTRDDAKTFIYAWVLNAGLPKVASILKTTIPIASKSKDRFESSIRGLKPFKSQLLPAIAEKGWFRGYDDRKVIVPNLHKTLAGILQNGEAVVMKYAKIKWNKTLRDDGLRFKPVTWVHDEWQTEVIGTKEEAEYVKEVQKDSIRWAGEELGFFIPLAGSGKIGKNWAETH